MAVTRETSRFCDRPLAESVEDFGWIRKQKPQNERKVHRHMQCWRREIGWLVHNFEPNTDYDFVNY